MVAVGLFACILCMFVHEASVVIALYVLLPQRTSQLNIRVRARGISLNRSMPGFSQLVTVSQGVEPSWSSHLGIVESRAFLDLKEEGYVLDTGSSRIFCPVSLT